MEQAATQPTIVPLPLVAVEPVVPLPQASQPPTTTTTLSDAEAMPPPPAKKGRAAKGTAGAKKTPARKTAATKEKKTPKSKAGAASSSAQDKTASTEVDDTFKKPQSLAEMIEYERRQCKERVTSKIQELETTIVNYQQELDNIPSSARHLYHRRRMLQDKLVALRAELEELHSGNLLAEQEKKLAPFVHVYETMAMMAPPAPAPVTDNSLSATARSLDPATTCPIGLNGWTRPTAGPFWTSPVAERGPNGRTCSTAADNSLSNGWTRPTATTVQQQQHQKDNNDSENFDEAQQNQQQSSDTSIDETDLICEIAAEFEDEPPLLEVIPEDVCKACNIPMILSANGSLLKCTNCGRSDPYIDATSSTMSYGEDMEFAAFTYKRINHFQQWMSNIQGKENTPIPDNICYQVCDYLMKNMGKLDVLAITKDDVREAMRKLKLRNYYDHCIQILWKITGIPPLRMTPDQEEMCKVMFMAIQGPFLKARDKLDPKRKNFLSYSYCLYKFCQLQRWYEFLPNFSLLKGQRKLENLDRLFKDICEQLDWDFIPSIIPNSQLSTGGGGKKTSRNTSNAARAGVGTGTTTTTSTRGKRTRKQANSGSASPEPASVASAASSFASTSSDEDENDCEPPSKRICLDTEIELL